MTHRTLRILLIAAVALAGFASAIPAAGAVTAEPSARIAKPHTTESLDHGGTQTKYTIALPRGAHCAGDTATGGYRVWSYIVPKGTDLSKISFAGQYPEPGYGFSNGEFVGPLNTEIKTGAIAGIPQDLDFSTLTADELFPEATSPTTWEGGVACADVHGRMSAYWNVELVFTKDATDPGGFTWHAQQAAGGGSSSGASRRGLLLLLVLVPGTAGAYVLRSTKERRREDIPAGGR